LRGAVDPGDVDLAAKTSCQLQHRLAGARTGAEEALASFYLPVI
jgi:hypothetical protein